MEYLIVTRHQGLVEVLSGMGITGKVVAHATLEDVQGKTVIGSQSSPGEDGLQRACG